MTRYKMKKVTEGCMINSTILEMRDCKHFRYNENKKSQGSGNMKILQMADCILCMVGINGCPKYCPLYESN
jgi:hypothetical protein